jgi:hypothetical protein
VINKMIEKYYKSKQKKLLNHLICLPILTSSQPSPYSPSCRRPCSHSGLSNWSSRTHLPQLPCSNSMNTNYQHHMMNPPVAAEHDEPQASAGLTCFNYPAAEHEPAAAAEHEHPASTDHDGPPAAAADYDETPVAEEFEYPASVVHTCLNYPRGEQDEPPAAAGHEPPEATEYDGPQAAAEYDESTEAEEFE